ncbi:hypothetical protein TH66_18400 [Carbonactinospora thermoautotrophica]|uniref:Putative Amino acid ABC transporter n=1 Tax=Carbonactinospora thermoautotrophica TaxID=1469144 RepID=A0A132MIG5_9ACTN|nr:MFS transporter [Carbonactinospora thermoautotrophica]KWW97559.1 hypothetical protein TH66_18400 [Carbonactinospora thermoautotrophica]KWW98897.1 putative Amino acid ABC transporter [Carbonactinospora thermoautotrophica]
MTSRALASPPYAARRAVFGYFFIAGAALAVWVAYIPLVKQDLRLGESALGVALLALAAGALAAMQVVGHVVERFGSRPVTAASAVLLGLSLAGPALAPNLPALFGALLVVGACNGTLDVAMNVQAVAVERRYGRPIMAAFHAVYSVGNVAGALAASLAIRAGLPATVTLPAAGILLAALAGCAARGLLGAAEEHAVPGPEETPAGRAPVPLAASLLGLVAFCCLVGEGAAADWSAVHLRDRLAAPPATAALGYAAFAAAMTTGRFLGDRVVGALGPVRVVRYGGLLAAAGFTIVVLAPAPYPALAGWAISGAGLAAVVPQIFTAAGNLPAGPRSLARATTLGYLGLLTGPPLIGFFADLTDLSAALAVPAVLALAVAAGAPLVRRAPG